MGRKGFFFWKESMREIIWVLPPRTAGKEMTLQLLADFHHSSVLAMCWLLSIRFYFCPVLPYRYWNSLQPARLLWDIFRNTISDPKAPFLCPQGNSIENVSGLGLCSKLTRLITWGETFCANKEKLKNSQWKLHSPWAQRDKWFCGQSCKKCASRKEEPNRTKMQKLYKKLVSIPC